MYTRNPAALPDCLATGRGGELFEPPCHGGRLLLRGGRLIDPKNNIDAELDIALEGDSVLEIAGEIRPDRGDRAIDCRGLVVMPGLIDMHVHLGDLFEVSTDPIGSAVRNGVTTGLSPGAGNTILAPSLLGAEVDRGLPMNVGVYIGAGSLLAPSLSDDEMVRYMRGTLDDETIYQKLTRNPIAARTGMLTVGVKDHMAHFVMSDENLERAFDITSRAGLIYMSHTQDPEHTARLARLSRGRGLYLGHATAAGCGTHGDALEAMQLIIGLLREPHIEGEFVSSMMRPSRGHREGLLIDPRAQRAAFEALRDGTVAILCSDGQGDAAMKGFGDTRDNIPAIFDLAGQGVLGLSQSVALMTCNPAEMLSRVTGNAVFGSRLGHLGAGAYANVTVAEPRTKSQVYTVVNGRIAAFEGRVVRSGNGAGGLVSRFGLSRRTGVGDLTLFMGGK